MPSPERPEQEFVPQSKESASDVKAPLESITANLAALQKKADRIQAEREQSIKNKIVDLETLTKKGDEVAKLKEKAEKMLAPLKPLMEREELKGDPELQAQVEAAESLLSDLRKQEREIFDSINKISQQPDVVDKIYEEGMEANAVVKKREVDAEADKKLKEELYVDAPAFVQKMITYAEKVCEWHENLDKLDSVSITAAKKIAQDARDAMEMLIGFKGDSEIRSDLSRISRSFGTISTYSVDDLESMITSLTNERKSLGFFAGKEKKAADFVLSQNSQDIETWRKASAEAEAKRAEGNAIRQTPPELLDELKRMGQKYQSHWVYSAVLSELGKLPKPTEYKNMYPADVWYKLEDKF